MVGTHELTLAELSAAAGMTPRNVRSYQSRGLLQPGRRLGRRIVYGPEHVARLRLVRALHDGGLSLKVVTDLLEQGTAEEELARLSREQLSTVWERAGRVPLTAANVQRYEQLVPGGMRALVESGAVVEDDGRLVASPTMLAMAGALYAHGVDLDVSARVILEAAAAARSSLPRLRVEAEAVSQDDVGLLVQLAACAYADALARGLDLW